MFRIFQETKSIKWIYTQKDYINFSPAYQRHSRLWKKEQKQLLIDSILNGLDVPKFYFNFMPQNEEGEKYNYAIIDGKQRIETILSFINNEFSLSNEFSFLDEKLMSQFGDISGKSFVELESTAPALIAQFWQYELSIVFMDATSPEIINELFVRLNSGVPVNTAEKRNANGGFLSIKIQELCNTSPFFNSKVKLANNRFMHNDLALKLLMIEDGVLDLTKKSIDTYLNQNREFKTCSNSYGKLCNQLDHISQVFEYHDVLLSKKNIIITMYTVANTFPIKQLRSFMEYFEKERMAVQSDPEFDNKEYSLIEFTRLLQQGADKKSSIIERKRIMKYYAYKYLIDKN